MVGIGSYCFVVFSEQLPPRRFAVSALHQNELTKADRHTYVELAAHLGVVQTREHANIVLNMLNAGQPWYFIMDVTSQEYRNKRVVLSKNLANKYGINKLEIVFQKDIIYQVGTDRRLLVAYTIRDPFNLDGDNLERLLAYNEPITYNCENYTIGHDVRLHVKAKQQQLQMYKYIFDERDFPSLQ